MHLFYASSRHAGSRSQRGEGKLKAIIYTAILVGAVYSAIKIIPAYVNEYQLQDKMQEQARFAVVNRYPEDKIRDIIFKEMEDLNIPAKREDIKIIENQNHECPGCPVNGVRISLDYTVPVDLLVYTINLHFTPSSENKSL